jgi:hypothetical protein
MGTWGVISPRTCPNCSFKTTVWWAMAVEKLGLDDITAQQRMTFRRILEEIPPATRDKRRATSQP